MTTTTIGRAAAWATVLALGAGTAFARDNPVHADAAFMKKAAESGLAEVQASQLAVTKATNTQVKGFAQQMVDDHTKTNEELKALAARKNITLPTEPNRRHRQQIKALQGAEGARFDARYAEQFGVRAHEDTVRLFMQASQKSKDDEVKAWVDKTLPALQNHLQMAKDLRNTTREQVERPASR